MHPWAEISFAKCHRCYHHQKHYRLFILDNQELRRHHDHYIAQPLRRYHQHHHLQQQSSQKHYNPLEQAHHLKELKEALVVSDVVGGLHQRARLLLSVGGGAP